jgi:hypothetical protein
VRLTHDPAGSATHAGQNKAARAAAFALFAGMLASGAVHAQETVPGSCTGPANGPAHTASPLLLQTGNGLLMVASSPDPRQLKRNIADMAKRSRPAAVLLLGAGGESAPAQALSRDLDLPVLAPVAGKAAASALFSKGTPSVQQSAVAWGGGRLLLLTHQVRGAAPDLLAAAWKGGGNGRTAVVWYRQGGAMALPDPHLELAGLEHLYDLLLRQDPEDRYQLRSLGRGTAAVDAKGNNMAHGALLAAIALQRECAARVPGKDLAQARPPAWRVVDMREVRPAEAKPGDRDSVAVRASTGGIPVAGATVTFARMPHMACTATTDVAGLASCRLVDTHGDATEHEEGDVIASFSGVIAPGRVDLPTTTLLRRPGHSSSPEHR